MNRLSRRPWAWLCAWCLSVAWGADVSADHLGVRLGMGYGPGYNTSHCATCGPQAAPRGCNTCGNVGTCGERGCCEFPPNWTYGVWDNYGMEWKPWFTAGQKPISRRGRACW